ncbi:MAG: hypothetical protein WCW14_00430 [Candidatus Paceibacterota bacterium]|jgi:hypothetical protein
MDTINSVLKLQAGKLYGWHIIELDSSLQSGWVTFEIEKSGTIRFSVIRAPTLAPDGKGGFKDPREFAEERGCIFLERRPEEEIIIKKILNAEQDPSNMRGWFIFSVSPEIVENRAVAFHSLLLQMKIH